MGRHPPGPREKVLYEQGGYVIDLQVVGREQD
jgi:hypothetical protein